MHMYTYINFEKNLICTHVKIEKKICSFLLYKKNTQKMGLFILFHTARTNISSLFSWCNIPENNVQLQVAL